MGIRDELAAMNAAYTKEQREKLEARRQNPSEQMRFDLEVEKKQAEARANWRPRRPRGEPGQRFRFPSRAKGAMDRRRRAQHAAQALPWHFRTNYELTEAEILVLATHFRNADENGVWAPSIAELASRAGVAPRTAQSANRRFVALGLLTIVERRETAYRNQPNIYTLDEKLRRSHKGAKSRAPKGVFESTDSVLAAPAEKNKGESNQPSSDEVSIGVRSKSPSKWRWIAAFGRSHSTPSVTELKVARAANRLLDEDQPAMADEALLWSRAEDLIEHYAPRLYGNLLAKGIRDHGFKALLAIYETALLSRCGHVNQGHGYLWGVLRKDAAECNPHVTLSRLFVARRMPGFLNDQATMKMAGKGWWGAKAADGAQSARDRLRRERSQPPALPAPA